VATKVINVDLALGPPSSHFGLKHYSKAMVLFRWKGKPLGNVWLDLDNGKIEGFEILSAAIKAVGERIMQEYLKDRYLSADPINTAKKEPPTCSVVVCTHDRPDDLKKCIASLCRSKADDIEIIIIDNAPSDDMVVEIALNYSVRYIREDRKGLNWARSRGAREAKGDIVIYTDDDVVVEPGWIEAMREPFADSGVSAVTGLIMPFELETEAQEYFERYFPFPHGFSRRKYDITNCNPILPGGIGAGASMAIRRRLITDLKLFDIEMDCGTATLSGGDTFAFYRLIANGYTIVYNPEAVCWHRHRREMKELRNTLYGYGVGTFVHLLHALMDNRDFDAIPAAYLLYRYWVGPLLVKGLNHGSDAPPLMLTLEFIKGSIASPLAYLASRHHKKSYDIEVSAKET
jgi:GT2 family glycosyltransferase